MFFPRRPSREQGCVRGVGIIIIRRRRETHKILRRWWWWFSRLLRVSHFFLSFFLSRSRAPSALKSLPFGTLFSRLFKFFFYYTFRVSNHIKERTLFELPPPPIFIFLRDPTHASIMKVRRCCSSIDFGPAFVSIIFSRSNLRRTRDSRSGWTERGSRERARGRRGCARFLRVFWVLFLRRKGEMRAF